MFGMWKARKEELGAKIAAAEVQIKAETRHAQSIYKYGAQQADKINGFFSPDLQLHTQKTIDTLKVHPPSCASDWEADEWTHWRPEKALLESGIRVGSHVSMRTEIPSTFEVPHYAPFIGSNAALIIVSDDSTAEAAIALLQSLAVRIAILLPHQARYTLIDPVGSGAAFPMQRYLPHVREVSDDIRRDLDHVSRDIQRIIAAYLDAEANSFEVLLEEIRVNERLEFILAANFPKRYDRRAIEALQSVGSTGPKAGKYLLLHHNISQELPREMSMEDFDNAITIDIRDGYGKLPDNACRLKFYPDVAPDAAMQKALFDKLSKAKVPQRNLDWDKTVGLAEEDWWTLSSAEIVETPIGGHGSSGLLNVWFGENNEKRVCAHGMLGAMTGAGKSTLYHVLIMGMAVRYSPEELRFYLIDGKQGVEFQPYRDLPHAEVVSLHSPPELSRSVLAELLGQMEYRYALFAEEDVRVQDLSGYHKKGEPKGKLPRIILLVDEYQELFEGDQDGVASIHLLKLSQQGRAAGIHMLLASQRFGAAGMMNRDAIFGNFHLLMSMQMRHDDIQALSGFGRRGKQMIMTCDLPGKIVVNDQLGDDGANTLGKVALLASDDRDRLIEKMNERVEAQFEADDLPSCIVLDGKEQPNIIENPQMKELLERDTWLTTAEWQAKARQSSHEGGFDIGSWFSAERPKMIWLGQEFSVRGQAAMVVRRRLAENVMVIGSENTARYGMLVGLLMSLVVNGSAQSNKVHIFDRSMAETQWCNALESISQSILKPAGYLENFSRKQKQIDVFIASITSEIDRRLQLEDDARILEPSVFVVMTELDQVDDIRRQADAYGMVDSPLGEQLRRVFVEGPRLGIHTALSFSGVRAMMNVIDDRRDLMNFRHRVALQMSEDESFTFVRNRLASRLQIDGSKPIAGLYLDVESDRTMRFKPYSIESTIPLDQQMQTLENALKQWMTNS